MLIHNIVTSSAVRHIDQCLRFPKSCCGLEAPLEIVCIVPIGDYKGLIRDTRHVAIEPRVEMMTIFRLPMLGILLELVSEVWLGLNRAPEVFPW